ncbi:hypothetical protein D3C79_702290 [compost metagenome]
MLARQVAQVVEQFGIDLDHVTRRAFVGRRRRVAGRGVGRGLAGSAVGQGGTAEVADIVDQRRGGMQRLPQAHGIEHVRQTVMAVLQQGEQRRARRQATGRQQLVEEFQFMGQVTDRGDLDHTRDALQGVQVTQQVVHLDRAARVGLPACQRGSGALDDVRAFFQEDFQQLLVARAPRFFGQQVTDHRRGQLQRGHRITAHPPDGLRRQGLLQQAAQGIDERRSRRQFLPGRDLVEHVDQCLVALLSQGKEARISGQAAFLDRAIEVEQRLADIIHLPQVGQVRPVPEGGQLIEQGLQRLPLARLLLPARQQRLGIEQNVHGLGQEAGDQLRVALSPRGMLRLFLQCDQALVHRLADQFDQLCGAGDGRQRRAVELRQGQVEQ